jgi:hypothetical protein
VRLRWLALAAALAFALIATWSLAIAQPRTFPGDAGVGATMHEKDCVACHVRRMGGDGSAMYTRAERRVTTPAKLKSQIAVCNTELATAYFPEEEEHLAAYLNLRYYKFED